ncbi:MAG TPA: hypothetical protein VFQ60_04420, partial [Patescibacteria group bacterium]|nr:hypothetical protein [Patescibacteria group bacterium]
MKRILGKSPGKDAEKKSKREDWSGSEDIEFDRNWWKKEILTKETKALSVFFGQEIPVPPIPDYVTPERLFTWEKLGLELHFLPRIRMAETIESDRSDCMYESVKPKSFPGWKDKPATRSDSQIGFFNAIKNGHVEELSLWLPGEWVLFETFKKPYQAELHNDVLKNTFRLPRNIIPLG